MRVMESLIQRTNSILLSEQIKEISSQWNQQHCKPSLDTKEFEKQWKCANKYLDKKLNSINNDQTLSGHNFS